MKKKLGRGLAALLPEDTPAAAADHEAMQDLNLSLIQPNRFQPRQNFDHETIHSLAESIRSKGLIQPIVVRPLPDGTFELISGERRLRAVQHLGLEKIPSVIKQDTSDQDSQVMALIENIQREDISPIEEAEAYRAIMTSHDYTQQQVAELVGKSRSAVANTLRLLDLSKECKKAVTAGLISEGHARILLQLNNAEEQDEMLTMIVAKNLTVRDLEKHILSTQPKATTRAKPAVLNQSKFNVSYRKRGIRGQFIVKFSSEEEFNTLKSLFLDA